MLKQIWVVFDFNCKQAFGARILNSPIIMYSYLDHIIIIQCRVDFYFMAPNSRGGARGQNLGHLCTCIMINIL